MDGASGVVGRVCSVGVSKKFKHKRCTVIWNTVHLSRINSIHRVLYLHDSEERRVNARQIAILRASRPITRTDWLPFPIAPVSL